MVIEAGGKSPRVLVQDLDRLALPTGSLEPEDRTLQLALRRLVREQTGRELGYVEQLYTFGDLSRDPRSPSRTVSVAYLALVRGTGEGHWEPVYRFFPWEDWRPGEPSLLAGLRQRVWEWADDPEKRRRARIMMGLEGTPWNGERVLERYELLYEVGAVEESAELQPGPESWFGQRMTLDHRRILATAMTRLRGKIRYRPVVFELLPQSFTLYQLQRCVESLAGVSLHKQNFRRLVEKQGLVEPTGATERQTGGRPARLYHFRTDVLIERPAPGVGLPQLGLS